MVAYKNQTTRDPLQVVVLTCLLFDREFTAQQFLSYVGSSILSLKSSLHISE